MVDSETSVDKSIVLGCNLFCDSAKTCEMKKAYPACERQILNPRTICLLKRFRSFFAPLHDLAFFPSL